MNKVELFLEKMSGCVEEFGKRFDVLPSLCIAQAILETGWGGSDLCVKANNLFGMKWNKNWSGAVYSTVTKECFDGKNMESVNGCFRAYDSWEESFCDYGNLLTGTARYKTVVGERDYKKACEEIYASGYASDPRYVEKLVSLIETYGLIKFDKKVEKNMSNSSLICCEILSPNKSKRKSEICKIPIHCMAGNMTVESCGNLFSKSSTKASSHYGIGSDGRIALYVNEIDRAWTTGGSRNNCDFSGSEIDHMGVTIEVANNGCEPDWPISDKAYESLVNLVEDIARRNGIFPVTFTGNAKGTLVAHRWFAAKECPGDYIYHKLGAIAEEVTRRLEGGVASGVRPSVVIEKKVRVTDKALNIRKGAGASFDVVGVITDCGVYTIVEEKGDWGRLKSGAGWISLKYTV